MTKLETLAQAIARYEGFYVTPFDAKSRGIAYPTIPQRLSNPGDLMFAGQRGAVGFPVVGKDNRTRIYAHFESEGMGWAALYAQIQLDAKRGETLAQFVGKYAPAADANDPHSYCNFVARQLRANPGDPLSLILEAS